MCIQEKRVAFAACVYVTARYATRPIHVARVRKCVCCLAGLVKPRPVIMGFEKELTDTSKKAVRGFRR